MITQFIPVKKSNGVGMVFACLLFILQFVYYQMQDVVLAGILAWLPDEGAKGLSWLPVNRIENLVKFIHIFMHAIFSIVIIHFLYRDRHSTWLVFYLSIILFLAYVITNLLGKVVDYFVVNIISTKIYFFIASPFKTIFSIPSLKLRNKEPAPE